MNQFFYIGALGAQQQQQSMNVTANNLANVNTYGFKADRSVFSGLMYENIKGQVRDEVQSGLGTRLWTTDTNFTQGTVVQTGRDQDYMIDGSGFFALVDLASGEISFTRNGAFTISSFEERTGFLDENGQPITETVYYLSDGDGRFVLGEDGNMIEVNDPSEMYPVGIFDYAVYDGMEHQEGTRFLPQDKNGGLTLGTGKLRQGMLENSNVDIAQEMTKLIETQRAYSMALRVVTTTDEIESTINSISR